MALTNGGTPTSQNYEIGRGRLLLDLFDTNGNPAGSYLDVGNVSAMTLSAEEETLDHQSSLEGLATTDVSVTLSKALNGSFSLEEITKENQQLFYSADLSTITQTTRASVLQDVTIPASGVGRWHKLYDNVGGTDDALDTSGVPIFKITGSPLFTGDSASPTYTEGTDYEVDADFGLFRLLSGGALASGITDGELTLSYTGEVFDQVRMLSLTNVTARLLFLSEDAYAGKKKQLRLHRVKLSASGDAAQIGDEWSTLGLEFTAESDTAFDSDSPYGDVIPVVLPS